MNKIKHLSKSKNTLVNKLGNLDYKKIIKDPKFAPILVAIIIFSTVLIFTVNAAINRNNQGRGPGTHKNSKGTASSAQNSNKSNSKNGKKVNSKNQASTGQSELKAALPKFNKSAELNFVDQELKSNKITPDQAKLIKDKVSEVDKFMSSLDSKSLSDRTRLVTQEKASLRTWAKNNGIPTIFLTQMVLF